MARGGGGRRETERKNSTRKKEKKILKENLKRSKKPERKTFFFFFLMTNCTHQLNGKEWKEIFPKSNKFVRETPKSKGKKKKKTFKAVLFFFDDFKRAVYLFNY